MLKITSLAAVFIALVVLGLFNLGLITIAGAGTPRVRYQAEEVTTPAEEPAWSFDDLPEGALPDGSEVLSTIQFGGWGVRAEAGTPSEPNALCRRAWVNSQPSRSVMPYWLTWS